MSDVAHFRYLETVADSLSWGKPIPLAPKFPAFSMKVFGFVEPKERARGKNFYTPPDTRKYEAMVKETAGRRMRELGIALIERPVIVHLTVKDKIHSKTPDWKLVLMDKHMLFEHTGGDLDNKVKAVLDGCNGVVYKDDRQIVQLFASRSYAQDAVCEVHVTPIGFTKNDLILIEKLINGQAKRASDQS